MNRLIATYKGHYKALFYLGLPIVIGQMGVIVLGFADTLMVGHHSTAELAAASFTNHLFTLRKQWIYALYYFQYRFILWVDACSG